MLLQAVPGGPELLIILFVLLLFGGGAAVLIGGAILLFAKRNGDPTDDATLRRLDDLEHRVEALTEQVERLESNVDDE